MTEVSSGPRILIGLVVLLVSASALAATPCLRPVSLKDAPGRMSGAALWRGDLYFWDIERQSVRRLTHERGKNRFVDVAGGRGVCVATTKDALWLAPFVDGSLHRLTDAERGFEDTGIAMPSMKAVAVGDAVYVGHQLWRRVTKKGTLAPRVGHPNPVSSSTGTGLRQVAIDGVLFYHAGSPGKSSDTNFAWWDTRSPTRGQRFDYACRYPVRWRDRLVCSIWPTQTVPGAVVHCHVGEEGARCESQSPPGLLTVKQHWLAGTRLFGLAMVHTPREHRLVEWADGAYQEVARVGGGSTGLIGTVRDGRYAFFAMDDGIHGSETWMYDCAEHHWSMMELMGSRPGVSTWSSPMNAREFGKQVYLSASIDAPGTHLLWQLGTLDSKGACTAPHNLGPPKACVPKPRVPPRVQRWSLAEQPLAAVHSEDLAARPAWEVKKRGTLRTGEQSDATRAEILIACRPWLDTPLAIELLLSEPYAELSPGSQLDVVVDSANAPGTMVARLKARFLDDGQRRLIEFERPDDLLALLLAGKPISVHLASGHKSKTLRWLGDWALRGASEAVTRMRAECPGGN